MEFAFGLPLPEGAQEEIQRQHDLHHMSAQTMRHDLFAFFESLDEEQAKQFSILVRIFAREESPYAQFIDGYISNLRERKFGICPGCNINHDEIPEDMQQAMGQQSSDLGQLEYERQRIGTLYIFTQEDFERMDEYNLDDLRDEDTHQLLGFICKGCGMRYISIADRMLRPPGIEGCSGCQLKSAHG